MDISSTTRMIFVQTQDTKNKKSNFYSYVMSMNSWLPVKLYEPLHVIKYVGP